MSKDGGPKKDPQEDGADDRELFIKPTSDVFVNYLWATPGNERFLLDFINAVLEDTGLPSIRSVEVLNPFNLKNFAVDKAIALDVRARDETGRMIDVEIQIVSHRAFANRILYYWSSAYCTQLVRGDNYGKLNPVLSIILTEFPFPADPSPVHCVYMITDVDRPDRILTDHFQMHFIRLCEAIRGRLENLAQLRGSLGNWVKFFVFGANKTEEQMSDITNHDPVIREAYAAFERFKSTPELREMERHRQRAIVDMQLMLGEARAEGEAAGVQKGIQEGKLEGKIEAKIETILLFLADRFDGVPRELEAKIAAIEDLEKLDALSRLSVKCNTLEEFEEKLG